MTNYSIFLRDNILVGNILPEKPAHHCNTDIFPNVCYICRAYDLAHAKALSEALEVVNRKDIIYRDGDQLCWKPSEWQYSDKFIKVGQYYAWPGKVEIVETCKWHGNRDACSNETCWDLYEAEGCQKSPQKKLLKLLPLSGTSQPEQKESEHLLCDCELSNMKGHPMMCFMCTGKRHKVPKDLDQKLSDSVDKDLKPEVNSAMSYTESNKDAKARIKAAAHDYANPKTKVIQSYTRLFDAFEAGAKYERSFKTSLPSVSEGETQEELWEEVSEMFNETYSDQAIKELKERYHITRIKK